MKIPYGRQEITREDIDSVVEVLQSDFLTQGPKIAEFEREFSNYIGAKYAVAVSNGTAALHLCAMALEVNASSRVITTPITFAASANCVRYQQGEVQFCDIDEETYCIDLQKLRAMLEENPKGTFQGVIPVDFTGHPVNTAEIQALARQYGLWAIEDACHAPGGYYTDANQQQQKSGNAQYTDLAIFSFHPVKHIAAGEGGMITTNNEKLYKRLLNLRTHGITKSKELMQEDHGGWYYELHELGYNYRLTDIQAALGLSQLKRAETNLQKRHAIADAYDKAFAGLPIKLPRRSPSAFHALHLYVILTSRRKELYDYLKQKNIFTQVHYIPLHYMPYYKQLGFKKGDFPVAERYYEQCLSLPMYPSMTQQEIDYVISCVNQFYS